MGITTLVDIVEGGGEEGRGVKQLPYLSPHTQKDLSLTQITIYFEVSLALILLPASPYISKLVELLLIFSTVFYINSCGALKLI